MEYIKLASKLRKFRKQDDGGVMIEGVLWLPVFILTFVMIVDASVLFMNQARIKRIMHDGSRQMAVGVLDTCADLEGWLETEARVIAPTATATCVETLTVSTARVSAASGELDLTGASGFFGGITVNVEMIYHLEVG